MTLKELTRSLKTVLKESALLPVSSLSRLALIIFGTSLPTVSTSLTGRRMVFR